MIRRKMRPDITGWAHVNGLRGETSSVDKMHLRPIARTALCILRDRAY
jgi:hypothetical protein